MARKIAAVIIVVMAVLAILALTHRSARAALNDGQPAPPFVAQAALGRHVFTFRLAEALKKGPVVLYFYPAAFTEGCTQEAHEFAEAINRYKALDATVIGVSKDDIKKLQAFGTSECRSKFAVASDEKLSIAHAYDAVIEFDKNLYANRVSYVIAQNGTIVYSYSSLDPDKHVQNTLAALEKLKKR